MLGIALLICDFWFILKTFFNFWHRQQLFVCYFRYQLRDVSSDSTEHVLKLIDISRCEIGTKQNTDS